MLYSATPGFRSSVSGAVRRRGLVSGASCRPGSMRLAVGGGDGVRQLGERKTGRERGRVGWRSADRLAPTGQQHASKELPSQHRTAARPDRTARAVLGSAGDSKGPWASMDRAARDLVPAWTEQQDRAARDSKRGAARDRRSRARGETEGLAATDPNSSLVVRCWFGVLPSPLWGDCF